MSKIYMSQHIKKCKYNQERIEIIFILYEILYYLLNIMIPYDWNKFCELCEEFDNYRITN